MAALGRWHGLRKQRDSGMKRGWCAEGLGEGRSEGRLRHGFEPDLEGPNAMHGGWAFS